MTAGYWVGLPLQALTKALLVAEALDTLDRVDERNAVVLTVPDGTAQGIVVTQTSQIPAGEVWYLNRLELITEAEVPEISASPSSPRAVLWIRPIWAQTRRLAMIPPMTLVLPDNWGLT